VADDMSIGALGMRGLVPDVAPGTDTPNVSAIPGVGETATTSFKDTVKNLIEDVNTKLTTSDQNVQDLATGRTNDMEKVVSSVEEANLALQYTMSIRTKLLDAYQEISRLQV
jgi:flagellar hook-basal body complex protein FliE